MMHSWRGTGWGWGGIVLMFGFMVLFWGAIAAVIVTLIRHGRTNPATPTPAGRVGPDAMAILDERYARGEIDDDEYQRRRQVLRSRP